MQTVESTMYHTDQSVVLSGNTLWIRIYKWEK